MIQLIDDGFQQKPRFESIMILVDFPRAFDKVCFGIPACYIRWIRNFLNYRKARVRLEADTVEKEY